LSQNYPNPFKDKTTIKYCIAYRSRVQISIYNSHNELIEKLLDEEKDAGTFEIEFRSVIRNKQLPDGDYYCQFIVFTSSGPVRDFIQTKKIILLK
jgi:hypothetical protein